MHKSSHNIVDWGKDLVESAVDATRVVGQQARDDEDYPMEEVSFTEVLTEARESRRRYLDTGEVGHKRSDGQMDVGMERATDVTPITMQSRGTTILEPMDRNNNGMRRRKSRMQRTYMTAGTGTNKTAPNHWRPSKPGKSTGSPLSGSVCRNDEVDA